MRRIITLVLIAALIFSLSLTGSAQTPEVCFLALNETVLDLSQTPFFYNGTAFVPYTVFGNFKVYSSYFSSNNTISLYRSDRQLYFNLTTAQVFDGNGNYYVTTIVRKNGVAYVPVPFVCNFFGLSWSYIEGIGYGDILRITNSSSNMTDSEFVQAASSVMQPRYESYIQSLNTNSDPNKGNESSSDTESHADTPVYLSFEGLPSTDILNTLDRFSVKAAFYLSPDDITADPDTVRRIYGSGHSIGILCGADAAADYALGSQLLLDAAQIRTVLVASAPENSSACNAFAQQEQLKYYSFDLDAADRHGYGLSTTNITNRIDNAHRAMHLRFGVGESTQRVLGSILNYLNTNNYGLRLEREV